MTKVNELGQQILKAKYYAPGESEPEHLFRRVAKVCSIPDVIDWFAMHNPKDPALFEEYKHKYTKIEDAHLENVFGEYAYLAKRVLERRGINNLYTPSEMLDYSYIQQWWEGCADKYFEAMANLDFLPATPTLISAGRGGMLSSCFFLRVEDSMEDIFDTVKKVALISKAGGGTGLDFSLLRPEGSFIEKTGGKSSGPLSFMRVFNETGNQVVSGGIRRAAMLAGLRVDHPDILKFIKCKDKEGEFSNFNLSVFVTNEFMNALKDNANVKLWHPKVQTTEVPAKEIWDAIVKSAWKSGEPGIIFDDSLQAGDVFSGRLGKLGVNPCVTSDTELLTRVGSYRIDKLVDRAVDIWNGVRWTNVTPRLTGKNQKIISFIIKNDAFPGQACLSCTPYHRFILHDKREKEASQLVVGDILDSWDYPNYTHVAGSYISEVIHSEKLEDVYCFTDPVDGCGMFNGIKTKQCGEISLLPAESCNLCAINLSNMFDEKTEKFDVEKFSSLVSLCTRFLDNVVDLNNYPLKEIEEATLKTRKIGLGVTGLHDLMLKSKIEYGSHGGMILIDTIFSTLKSEAQKESYRLGKSRGIPKALQEINLDRRNSTLLTCMPAGTVSTIANQVSSGIEPVFQWEYTRKDSYGTHKIRHFMLDKFGSIDELSDYAKTALEISPEAHVGVQAAIQKWVDNNISKTTNLPNHATIEDVDKIYKMAHKTGCKSITVYRSGSRINEVLNKVDKKESEVTKEQATEPYIEQLRERPRILFGCTFKVMTPDGKMYLTLNEDGKGLREVLLHIAKAGASVVAHTESEGRLISTLLKHNVPIRDLIRQLENQKSASVVWDHGTAIKSVPDAIAKTMQEYMKYFEGFSQYIEDPVLEKAEEETEAKLDTTQKSGDICPECGEPLYHTGGCESCTCGYSRCG